MKAGMDGMGRRVAVAAVGVIGLLPGVATAEVDAGEAVEPLARHRVSATGALTSSDCYQVQFSYHYMIWRYLGVGGSVGNWQNYFQNGHAHGAGWYVDDDDNKPWNLYLRPSVVLKSPALRIKGVDLSLYAEPGVMLNIPYRRVCIESTHNSMVVDYDYISTTGGQWLAFDIHVGINVDIDPLGISLGYLMSNLDVYSQQRHLSYNGVSFRNFYPKKRFMQGAYLTLSYSF